MWRSLLIASTAFAVTLWLAPRLEELQPAEGGEEPVPMPPEVMRLASGGFEAVWSDWKWLEAIQCYGTRSNELHYYRELPVLLEASIDLDPEFDYVYQFAGLVGPERVPGDPRYHNVLATERILRKGMESHSTRWQIPFLLGYSLYRYQGDFRAAGYLLKEAAQRRHAPKYLASFVATLLGQSGDIDTAISFTEIALGQAFDKWTINELQERLQALNLQKELDQLNAAARARAADGKPVTQLADLVGYADVSGIPEDPFGGAYRVEGGRVVSSHADKLVHTFVHPGEPPTQPWVD
jgi:hypothetical protein